MAQADGRSYLQLAIIAMCMVLVLSVASAAATAPARSLSLPGKSTRQLDNADTGQSHLSHTVQHISILVSPAHAMY